METITPAATLQKTLAAKMRMAKSLNDQLAISLAIQSIWPEAFAAGKCSFSGIMVHDGRTFVKGRKAAVPAATMRESWFERADGLRYNLSLEEFKRFKPDMVPNRLYTD